MTDEKTIADRVAARYKSKFWWADLDDLRQEALYAICRAKRTFNADEGFPFEAYAWRAAVLTVRRYVLKMSSPVSASNSEDSLLDLKGTQRAAIDPSSDWFVHNDLNEEALSAVRAKREILRRLQELLAGMRDGEIAEAVLLNEEKSATVAKRYSVPVTKVYGAAQRARRMISADADLWRLWNYGTRTVAAGDCR